ncbi:MAG: serine hydrolase domain-containing protein [Pseudomonadota bacterium]
MILRVLFLFLVCGAATAEEGRLGRVQATLPEIDRMYAELAAKEHLPGLIYGVVLDGKLVHSKAYGLANVERQLPPTTATRFRIASMSKSFVAMAALRLRDEGKLRLDDPVARYLPELSTLRLPTSDSPTLTIRHLMSMSTGLPQDDPWGDRQMEMQEAELARFVAGGLSFSNAPGSYYEYSNLGYVMLGRIVTKVAGMRFQDYVTQHIFQPLGMKDTTWEYASVPADQLALGYRWTGQGWEVEPMLHDGAAAAMGGVLTTLDDFARYVAFHLNAWPARDGADTGPVRRATVREMQLPKMLAGSTPTAGLTNFYSFGMRSSVNAKGMFDVGHSGGLPGFGSQYRLAPEQGIGIIAFSNLRYGPVYQPTISALATLVARAVLPARAVPPSPVLLQRQQQLVELIQHWDPALAAAVTADNFFLDRSRADWIADTKDLLGKVISVGPLKADNLLRGSFVLTGEHGALKVSFTLTPEKDPKVQELNLLSAKL